MVEVTLSDYAIQDMEDIYDFIARDSVYYASKQIDKFFERIELLQTFPLSGKIVPEFNMDTVRELIEGRYRILYRIYSEQSIIVLSVHHSSRLL